MRNMIAFYLQRDHNIRPITDGEGQVNLPLTDAIALAKRGRIAVEIHTNAHHTSTANGVEVIAMPRRKAQAQAIARAISGAMGNRLRGDGGWIDQSQSARGRLGFISQGDGLIIELFFISNHDELAKYLSVKWLVAKAIAATIASLA
jgi:N-acetylmuramoyl-L-alanine amidase